MKNLRIKVHISDVHYVLIGYVIASVFATWKLLLGEAALARDWALPMLPKQYQISFLKDFYSFYDWGGGEVTYLSSSYPLTAFMAALSVIGIDGATINKLIILLVTVGSGFSLYYLARALNVRPWPSFAAGLFYMSTHNVVGRFWQGHIAWIVSYALAPLALALFIRSTTLREKRSLEPKEIVVAGLVYALSWVQTHFFPMMFILFLAYSVFGNSQEIRKRVKGFLAVNIIAFLIHLPWLSFVIFGSVSGVHRTVIEASTQNFTVDSINALKSTFLDSFRLIGYFFTVGSSIPTSYLDPIGKISLAIVLLIPAIASATILFRKDKVTGYFLLVGIVALLISARDSPIGGFVTWLELNSPLIFFEDNFHFIFLVSIAFSVLLGLATEELGKRWYKLIVRYVSPSLREHARLRAIEFIAALMVILVVAGNAPFYTTVSGTGRSLDIGEDNRNTFHYINDLSGHFRVAWLPLGSMGRSEYTTEEPIRDSLILYSPKPAIDTDRGLWHPYYAFIAKTFESKRTQYLGKLLGETSGVKYFILRDDFISHYQYAYGLVNDQKELLEGQKGLTLEREFGDKQIFSNAEYAPLVRAGKAAIVSGDLASLLSLSYYYEEVKEERLPILFFASQLTPEDHELFEQIDTIIISNDNINDLRFAFVPERYRFDAGLHTRSLSDPNKGWIYVGLQWWRLPWPFVTQLEPVAFTLTKSRLDIPFTTEETTSYEIWAKVLLNHRGGTLDFQVDNEGILKIDTLPPANLYEIEEAVWKWVHIGSVELNSGQHQLSIVSDGEANAVGRIIIAPSPVVQQASGSLYSTFRNKHVIVISEAERCITDPTVLASRIGPTVSGGVTLTTGMPRDLSLNFTTVSNSSYSVIMRRSNPPRLESSEALYDDFEGGNDWGGGDIPLSTLHVNTGNFSLLHSLTINKTSGETHVIGKAFPSPVDLRNVTTASFFVYVETNSSSPSSQLNFGVMTSKGTGYAWNFYVANNKENLVKLDLAEFKDRGNITSVHFSIGDAWGTYSDKQHLNIYFDTLFFLSEPTSESDFQWHDLTEQHLAAACSNEIRFPVRTGGMGIDLVVIESNISSKSEIPVTNITRINPAKYTLHVDASEPFFLAFYSNYHPLWKASAGQQPFEHFRGNFFANAYYVDKTGKYTITLEFAYQPVYGIGMLLGYTTIIVCVFIGVVPKSMLNKILRYLRSKVQ